MTAVPNPEPSAPSTREISSRSEILALVRQAPRVRSVIRIISRDGGGFGHLWPSKRHALQLLADGELDGFIAELIDGTLLVLNGTFDYALHDAHKTERFQELAERARTRGHPVSDYIAKWLEEHPRRAA